MKYSIAQIYSIYCIHDLGNGEFILLNRLNKPLGVSSAAWVDFKTHPSKCTIENFDSEKAKRIGFVVSKDPSFSGSIAEYYFPRKSVDESAYKYRVKCQNIIDKINSLLISVS